MAGDKELYKKGIATQFSSTNQPRKKGRKPSILKKLKAIGLSHEDITGLLENIIMANKQEAQEMLKNPELPIMAVGYLSALIKEIQAGKSLTIEAIIDRLDGKATQKVQAETTLRDAQPPAIYFGEEDDEIEQEE
jgi:hypothetical protein|nr:MAG TPA: hypothetical protein [Caudoviricetes sp.]